MGDIQVPSSALWGAQTQRSLQNFAIGDEQMPIEIIYSLALIKKAAATANHQLGRLDDAHTRLIISAADEVREGEWDDQFPLHVWQTGSGTQTNMNVNEVISNRASQIAGEPLGSKNPVHPNDHVNMSQSSNDVFPSALHIATAVTGKRLLLPALDKLANALAEKADDWQQIVKIGRTHLQDAVPLTLGQEFSGFAASLREQSARIGDAITGLLPLVLGGTAIGTGLNAPAGFAEKAVAVVASETDMPFIPMKNRFAGQGCHDALVHYSATLRGLATTLHKIANDIRLLGCGPRCGFNELLLPANEPGSSIMPGKVNPTQCEAMSMVTLQVMANDSAVSMGNAGGMLEMNVYKPLMGYNILQSSTLLTDTISSFRENLIEGLEPNREQIAAFVERSLMLVTALNPVIGYENAAKVAKYAYENNVTLKEACEALELLSPADFNRHVDPRRMTGLASG